MSAFLSGEMKDTVQMNPAGAYGTLFIFRLLLVFLNISHHPVLERFFSRKERRKLFHSWSGSASMWIKVSFRFYLSSLKIFMFANI
jgi:phospholipid:diacylglycerol acyltransferase